MSEKKNWVLLEVDHAGRPRYRNFPTEDGLLRVLLDDFSYQRGIRQATVWRPDGSSVEGNKWTERESSSARPSSAVARGGS